MKKWLQLGEPLIDREKSKRKRVLGRTENRYPSQKCKKIVSSSNISCYRTPSNIFNMVQNDPWVPTFRLQQALFTDQILSGRALPDICYSFSQRKHCQYSQQHLIKQNHLFAQHQRQCQVLINPYCCYRKIITIVLHSFITEIVTQQFLRLFV